RNTLPSHCVNLKGGTSVATSIAGFSARKLLQKPDPGLADAGLPVRQALQIRPSRFDERSEYGFSIRQRDAADEVHDWMVGAVGGHGALPGGDAFRTILAQLPPRAKPAAVAANYRE